MRLVDCGVELSGNLAIFLIGRDEGCDGDGGRVGEEFGDLVSPESSFLLHTAGFWTGSLVFKTQRTYLSDPPDVLIPVLLAEPEILVQAEAHVVAIEPVCSKTEM